MDDAAGHVRFENAPDDTRIRVGTWTARTPETAGRVVLLHGRTEFVEKYAETAGELTARGFDVLTMDWRGQGLSNRLLPNRQKGHIDSYDAYLHDLDWFMRTIVPAEDGKPVFVFAHSMGGTVAMLALLERRIAPQGMVLAAPMIGLNIGRAGRSAARMAVVAGLANRYVPGSGAYDPARLRFDRNPLTSDPVRFRRIHDMIAGNPALALGGPTWGWVNASFAAIARIRLLSALRPHTPPVLICAAENDRVVSNAALRDLCGRIPGCSFAEIAGARHEILQETDAIRRLFWERFDDFVRRL